MNRVVWDDRALDELDAAKVYIAKDSPRSAQRVVDYILHTALILETSPRLGRIVHESGLRELVLSKYPYILGYILHEDEVRIVALNHYSQQRR